MTIGNLFSVKHLEVSLAYRMPCLRRDCVEQNSEKELQVIKSARSNNKFILKINAITLSIFLLTNYGIKPIKNNAK